MKLHVLVVALVLAGCAARPALIAAPGAPVLDDRRNAVLAEAEGVRVVADPAAWRGFPAQLEIVTAVKVRIRNGSPVPIRLSYGVFTLQFDQGLRVSALPPFGLRGTERVAQYSSWSPRFRQHRFFASGPYRGHSHAPGFHGWEGPWVFDPYAYDRQFHYWPVELPTRDMVAQALPEGVLLPAGEVDGFIYFQQLPRGKQPAQLQVALVNAETGARIGQLDLPFLYRGH